MTTLYGELDRTVVPMFYRDPARFADVTRQTVALNGSFFNTQHMVQQYALKAWFDQVPAAGPDGI